MDEFTERQHYVERGYIFACQFKRTKFSEPEWGYSINEDVLIDLLGNKVKEVYTIQTYPEQGTLRLYVPVPKEEKHVFKVGGIRTHKAVRVDNLMYVGCEAHWKCTRCGECVPFHCFTKEAFEQQVCKGTTERRGN